MKITGLRVNKKCRAICSIILSQSRFILKGKVQTKCQFKKGNNFILAYKQNQQPGKKKSGGEGNFIVLEA